MIDLSPRVLADIQTILAKHVPHCEVRMFGSRVLEKAKPFSDVDLVVVGEKPLDLNVMTNLEYAFEDSDLPYRVDVLDWHAISEDFRRVILKKYEVIQKSR